MVGAVEHAARHQGLNVVSLHGSVSDSTLWSVDLDEWLEPEHAARTVTHDSDIASDCLCVLGDGGRDFVGSD